MKHLKTLLLATTIFSLTSTVSAKSYFEGTHVGAHIGASKASKTKRDAVNNVSFTSKPGYSHSMRWGVHGGGLVGYREAVSQDTILGISLGADFENTHDKETISQNNASTEAKRRYTINLLGQIGKTVDKSLMPYAILGVSLAEFKLSSSENSGAAHKNKHKFGAVGGVGMSHAINDKLSTDIQYLYTYYNKLSKSTVSGNNTYTENAPRAFHAITAGLKINI